MRVETTEQFDSDRERSFTGISQKQISNRQLEGFSRRWKADETREMFGEVLERFSKASCKHPLFR